MVKKRKTEMDACEDSTFFQSFVGAANAVSHMYTQAVKEQRSAAQAGTRQALERIAQWVDMQGTSEVIAKAALQELLNEEHLKAGGGGLYARQQRLLQHRMDEECLGTAMQVPWEQPNQVLGSPSFHVGHDMHPTASHGEGLRNPECMLSGQTGGFSFPQFGVPPQYRHQSATDQHQGLNNKTG